MSISDMTNIPRATIIRKCKYLIKNDLVKMNEKNNMFYQHLILKKFYLIRLRLLKTKLNSFVKF